MRSDDDHRQLQLQFLSAFVNKEIQNVAQTQFGATESPDLKLIQKSKPIALENEMARQNDSEKINAILNKVSLF